jgi:hypothetical protein
MIERRGIPAVLIGTDRFRSVFLATRRLCGVEQLQWAEVPHPLGSLGVAELHDRARLAVEQFARIVLSDGT